MSKAVGYVRVPPETFSESDGRDSQKLRISVWIRESGLSLAKLHVENSDASPKSVGPALHAALGQLKAGDVLVVDRLSLAASSLTDWIGVVERVITCGADLVSVSDGFDTRAGTPGGKQVARLLRSLYGLPRHASESELYRLMDEPQEDTPKVDYMTVYQQSKVLLHKHRYDQAVQLWRQFLDHATGEPAACGWNCMGDIHDSRKQMNEAVSYFLRAAAEFEKAGYPDRALAMFNKAQRHAPSRNDIHLNKARLFTQLERIGDAVACYLAYAHAQVEKGYYDKAQEVFNKIRILDPVNARFRLQLADEMYAFGFADDALEEVLCAAELMTFQGHPELAREQLTRALESAPDNHDVSRFLERLDNDPAGVSEPVAVAANGTEDFMSPGVDLRPAPEQAWNR